LAEALIYDVPGLPMVLRRKAGGRVWTVRIKLPRKGKDFGRVERSTGERDLKAAIRAAHQIYAELNVRIESRKALSDAPTFSALVDEYLDEAAEQQHAGRITKIRLERDRIALRRHFVPSLGHLLVDQIRTSTPRQPNDVGGSHEARDLQDFLNKRLTNRHQPAGSDEIVFKRNSQTIRYKRSIARPSPETLRRERQSFYAVMEFARDRGYLADRNIPTYPKIAGQPRRRNAFTREEMRRIQEVSIKRIIAAKHPLRRRQRLLCHLRMMWIYLTGCRPQEIAHITHGDLDDGIDVKGNASIRVKLKDEHLKHPTHKRTVVPLPGFIDYFGASMVPYLVYENGDYIFASRPHGKPPGSSNKMFRRLLKAAALDNGGVRIDPRNPLYSIRHTFITERLYEGMEIGQLARWCGTSVAMIERHYDHVRSDIEMTPREKVLYNPVVVPLPEEVCAGIMEFELGKIAPPILNAVAPT